MKTLLVTGGSRGIGAATALRAAKAGWRVVVNYRADEASALGVVEAIRSGGGDAYAVQGDMSREADILSVYGEIDRRGQGLDGLVNNAGVVDQKARLDGMEWARLERMMRTNLIGPMLCAREAVRRMSTAHGGQGGVIVNLSSAAALLGSPALYVDYAASKGAIDTFTKGLALEVAREGIRVCGVRPGIIATDIHASGGQPDRVAQSRDAVPMGREGSAAEVAEGIVFLLSDAASYMTGTTINITGGR
ncbi:MAG: SDR family oxidoreductase [Notoacmeibacter sp.]|nr:SDR family oxidoreductase [Notoacmeibacter sp.]